MSASPTVADLLLRNVEYEAQHDPIATFEERFESGLKGPSVAIVTCADPRCIPENFLKLNTWDAVVIRTAGSNVKAALPSLIAIDALVGLQEIMVINHTDCGAQAFRDESIRTSLKVRAHSMSADIDRMEFGQIVGYVQNALSPVLSLTTISSLEDRVREHVAVAKDTTLLRQGLRSKVTGYIYDLKSGALKRVE